MHRDLKPENILLDPETCTSISNVDEVKLVDFGLSKKRENDSNTAYIATRWYRAPEVILGLSYDKSVDVFALGAVMLEMYLGYGAFPGNDAIDQLNKVFAATGTPTKENWPEGVAMIEQKKIQFPQYPKTDLRKHIPSLCDEGIDLLTRMVKCNPKERISIEDMVQHPYFKRVTDLLPSNLKNFIYRQIPISPKIDKLLINPPLMKDKHETGVLSNRP